MQKAIKELELKMAELKAQIDAIDARIVPVDAEIDALLAEQQVLQQRIDAAAAKLTAARGMPAKEYLALKKRYGELASTRMQMRRAAKAL
jgi:hypothetical protein